MIKEKQITVFETSDGSVHFTKEKAEMNQKLLDIDLDLVEKSINEKILIGSEYTINGIDKIFRIENNHILFALVDSDDIEPDEDLSLDFNKWQIFQDDFENEFGVRIFMENGYWGK